MASGGPPEKRQSVRKLVELDAVVEIRGSHNLALGSEVARTRLPVLLRDISATGFRFVVPAGGSVPAGGLFPRGATLTLELALESGEKVKIVGTVAWSIAPAQADQPTSVGVRSLPQLSDAATQRALKRWVALTR